MSPPHIKERAKLKITVGPFFLGPFFSQGREEGQKIRFPSGVKSNQSLGFSICPLLSPFFSFRHAPTSQPGKALFLPIYDYFFFFFFLFSCMWEKRDYPHANRQSLSVPFFLNRQIARRHKTSLRNGKSKSLKRRLYS